MLYPVTTFNRVFDRHIFLIVSKLYINNGTMKLNDRRSPVGKIAKKKQSEGVCFC